MSLIISKSISIVLESQMITGFLVWRAIDINSFDAYTVENVINE